MAERLFYRGSGLSICEKHVEFFLTENPRLIYVLSYGHKRESVAGLLPFVLLWLYYFGWYYIDMTWIKKPGNSVSGKENIICGHRV